MTPTFYTSTEIVFDFTINYYYRCAIQRLVCVITISNKSIFKLAINDERFRKKKKMYTILNISHNIIVCRPRRANKSHYVSVSNKL